MIFKERSFYKHRYMRDVLFRVRSNQSETPESYQHLHISWYLDRPIGLVPMGVHDDITITSDNYSHYKERQYE